MYCCYARITRKVLPHTFSHQIIINNSRNSVYINFELLHRGIKTFKFRKMTSNSAVFYTLLLTKKFGLKLFELITYFYTYISYVKLRLSGLGRVEFWQLSDVSLKTSGFNLQWHSILTVSNQVCEFFGHTRPKHKIQKSHWTLASRNQEEDFLIYNYLRAKIAQSL